MMLIDTYLAKSENEMNYGVAHPEHYEGLPLLVYLLGAGEFVRCSADQCNKDAADRGILAIFLAGLDAADRANRHLASVCELMV